MRGEVRMRPMGVIGPMGDRTNGRMVVMGGARACSKNFIRVTIING
jgi:hypothetical protein